jgi:hypothetical protein
MTYASTQAKTAAPKTVLERFVANLRSEVELQDALKALFDSHHPRHTA